MSISSRTPEGLPSHCPLCGCQTNLEFSDSIGDAPCPSCGHLLWRSSQLFAQVQLSLAAMLAIPVSEITPLTSFQGDLRADSLDVVEFMMELEDCVGVSIPDDDYELIRTIGDVVRYVERQERVSNRS